MISDETAKSLSAIRAMLDVSAAAVRMIGQTGASPTLSKSVPLMINAAVEMIDHLRSQAEKSSANQS